MKDTFTVVAFGDVVGPYATEKLCRNLRSIKDKYSADLAIVNAENAAKGNGLDVPSADGGGMGDGVPRGGAGECGLLQAGRRDANYGGHPFARGTIR